MERLSTEQEIFWKGKFGDGYTDRNTSEVLFASKLHMFSKILKRTVGIGRILELGANRGLNLRAISFLKPQVQMQAVEINEKAAKLCSKIENVNVFTGSIYDYPIEEDGFDLSFTAGVLIHIAPERLTDVYDILYKSSKRYIAILEYYNPTPVEIKYRGNDEKLFKRDFAGEIMAQHSDLQLIDYGFFYHGDNNFKSDDITYFLMEKK